MPRLWKESLRRIEAEENNRILDLVLTLEMPPVKLHCSSWDKIRLKILERDKYECKRCGLNSHDFQVHHMLNTHDEPRRDDLENIITLCTKCHRIVEGYKKALRTHFIGIYRRWDHGYPPHWF